MATRPQAGRSRICIPAEKIRFSLLQDVEIPLTMESILGEKRPGSDVNH